MKIGRKLLTPLLALAALLPPLSSHAAGTLSPKGSTHLPIAIRDHHVSVTLNNGFARTEVTQTFYNPNAGDLEAIYQFPLPQRASLSEVVLTIGEREISGEVIERENAASIYKTEKAAGNETGLATKESFHSFQFRVYPVKAQGETRIRLVYYEPLEIDTGIGRYLYPLEEGGTEDLAAASFWNPVHDVVEGTFSAEIIVKSAWPIEDVRLPGFEQSTKTEKKGEGEYRILVENPQQQLDQDLVVYYRLAQDLPGRVELIPFRDDASKPGTFMMVVTPGLDLQPITQGADYVYVLDTSGSMATKLHTLTDGVVRAIQGMSGDDRYRIVTFSDRAAELTYGWNAATPENIEATIQRIQNLQTSGGTNLYAGLSKAMTDLDDDRATSVVLVTDGVTNQGVIDAKEFHDLSKKHDIRVFGFLFGNSANWPLMRTICDASGGFYTGISNADDILGSLLKAKSKIKYESLHDAEFSFKGVKTFDVTNTLPGKIYRGEQLVLFGRYEKGGEVELKLKAHLTGEDKIYRTTFDFPELDPENPEIERLWALDQIEQFTQQAHAGTLPMSESEDAIRDLGLTYQLVTDETSMLVLSDEGFNRHGIERHNQERTAREHAAQSTRRQATTPKNHRVDTKKPFTSNQAPRMPSFGGGGGGGGGALPPFAVLLLALFSGVAVRFGVRRKA